MSIDEILEDVKLEVTGGISNLEIPDKVIEKIINKSLKEVQRYCDETRIVTMPYKPCIDLTDQDVSSISAVYRASDYDGPSSIGVITGGIQGMNLFPTYNTKGFRLGDYLDHYLYYNTLKQVQNTMSTDLAYKFDKQSNKLYINCLDKIDDITIEFVPNLHTVDDLKTSY